jgi:hypothetical protein
VSIKVKLKQLSGMYAIAQLSCNEDIPKWADGKGFVSITRTDDELSVVCIQSRIPPEIKIDAGWKCFKFVGPFAFDESGVILSVIQPLSTNGLGVFIVATFDGDILLLKNEIVEISKKLLINSGHIFL